MGIAGGIATTLGVSAGLGSDASLSLLGVGYLIYQGMALFLAKSETVKKPGSGDRSFGNTLLSGLPVALANAGAIVLFAGVFASNVTVDTPLWSMAFFYALVGSGFLVSYYLISTFTVSDQVMSWFEIARIKIERSVCVRSCSIGRRVLADRPNPVAH